MKLPRRLSAPGPPHGNARRRPLSRAAVGLHLTQPAVSQHMAALEAELGARLVERDRRMVRLTDAGRALLARAEPILHELAEMKRAVVAATATIAGDLRVAASLTVGEYVLPPILARFGNLHPQVRVRVTVQNTERVGRALASGEADLGFVEGRVSASALTVVPFRQDELVAVAASGHPWARRGTIRLDDLLDEPLVLREPGSGTRQVLEERLRAAGVDPSRLRVVMELSGTEAIKTAVEAGIGASVLSRSAIQKELRLRTLIAREVRQVPMRRTMAVAMASGSVMLPAARALSQLAAERGSGGTEGLEPWDEFGSPRAETHEGRRRVRSLRDP